MATELAKAYVQIVPSAQGIQGSITNALGGEAGSAGKSLGGKLAGALKGALATAAIGKALSAAITEGAALEQSLGGIETLFKDNAETVKQYAAQAYRTAGMSANEYMQMVTGFSASLLQSLGGDTAKAAQTADMALSDMSDNANKMGTSMEDIKNAYQGFAKQNYTMLDNLKLGYGGTKTEMQRLLADAQKLTGVEYDINNLDDVYNAIHAIQGEMGITGTTALEASSTITGSMAAMKASFKDVLGNLTLGREIGPSLQALAKTTSTFLAGNLLPAIGNILKGFGPALLIFVQDAVPQLVTGLMQFIPQLQSAFVAGLPQLMQMVTQLLTQFSAGLSDGYPQLLQGGMDMLAQLVSGVAANLPMLFQAALSTIVSFVTGIIANAPQIIESGKNLLLSIVSGIQQSLPQMLTAAAEAIGSLLSGLISNLPQIIAAGFDLIVSLISGIGTALPNIIAAAGDAARSLWNTILETDWLQLGKDIISGLINGIGAMAGALWDAAVNIAKSALDAIKSFFGINSPSRVMRDEVGKMIPAGIAVGIERNTKPITNAMKSLAELTTGTLQTDLSLQLSKNSTAGAQLAYAGGAPEYGAKTYFYQTINSHDSLSPAEMTRETENLLERSRWKNP